MFYPLSIMTQDGVVVGLLVVGLLVVVGGVPLVVLVLLGAAGAGSAEG